MKIPTKSSLSTPLRILLVISAFCVVLVAVIAFRYSYDTLTTAESGIGFVILLASGGGVWWAGPRLADAASGPAIRLGYALGLLWVVEIGINNFVAPPLPARDIIDNLFWGAIAAAIFFQALIQAYRARSFRAGLRAGIWSGWVSGTLACVMALAMIVLGMPWILRDPLNVSEWAARSAAAKAPGMAAYFAYETFAGAFLHLTVLGPVMGGLLGSLGGILGKGIRWVQRWS